MYERRHLNASENELRYGILAYEKEFARRVILSTQKLTKCLGSSSVNEAFLEVSNVIISQLPNDISGDTRRSCVFLVIRPLLNEIKRTSQMRDFFIRVRNRNRAVLNRRQEMNYEELEEIYKHLQNIYFFHRKVSK